MGKRREQVKDGEREGSCIKIYIWMSYLMVLLYPGGEHVECDLVRILKVLIVSKQSSDGYSSDPNIIVDVKNDPSITTLFLAPGEGWPILFLSSCVHSVNPVPGRGWQPGGPPPSAPPTLRRAADTPPALCRPRPLRPARHTGLWINKETRFEFWRRENLSFCFFCITLNTVSPIVITELGLAACGIRKCSFLMLMPSQRMG